MSVLEIVATYTHQKRKKKVQYIIENFIFPLRMFCVPFSFNLFYRLHIP